MTTVKEAMSELGRIGGRVKSARKAEASRRNGKLGGKKKQQPPVALEKSCFGLWSPTKEQAGQ